MSHQSVSPRNVRKTANCATHRLRYKWHRQGKYTWTQVYITYTVSTDCCQLSLRTPRGKEKTTRQLFKHRHHSQGGAIISRFNHQGLYFPVTKTGKHIALNPHFTPASTVLLGTGKQDLTFRAMIHPSSTLSSLFQTLELWMGSLPPSGCVLIPRDLGKPVSAEPLKTNHNVPSWSQTWSSGGFSGSPFYCLFLSIWISTSGPHICFHQPMSLSLTLSICLSSHLSLHVSWTLCMFLPIHTSWHSPPPQTLFMFHLLVHSNVSYYDHTHSFPNLPERSLGDSFPGTSSLTKRDTIQMTQGPLSAITFLPLCLNHHHHPRPIHTNTISN